MVTKKISAQQILEEYRKNKSLTTKNNMASILARCSKINEDVETMFVDLNHLTVTTLSSLIPGDQQARYNQAMLDAQDVVKTDLDFLVGWYAQYEQAYDVLASMLLKLDRYFR